jgi:hypothetical protein
MHKKMEVISVKKKRKVGFFPVNISVVKKGQHTDLDGFLKGTISGEELVKYVCDKLDEKYSPTCCGI